MKPTTGHKPVRVAGYLGHLGFTPKPSVLELGSGLVEEPPVKREGGKLWRQGRDVRNASGCGGREPSAGEVKTPFGFALEEALPNRVIPSIYAPCL